jgi:hypothetical protein
MQKEKIMIKIVNMGDGVISAAADDDDTNDENIGAASQSLSRRVVAVALVQRQASTSYQKKLSPTSGPHIFYRNKR